MPKDSPYSKSRYILLSIVGLFVLAGCDSDNRPADSSQVVARVNDSEVTIHQLNLELSDKRLASQPNQEQVQRAVLERLIDKTLLVNKAREKELHRNPITMQAIERAKQKVLAQAYMQTVLGSLTSPADAEINLFYEQNPELFSKRRVYHLQQLAFTVDADKDAIKAQLAKADKFTDFTRWVQEKKIPARPQTITQGAERIPTVILEEIKDLPAGKGVFIDSSKGVVAVWIVAAKELPLDIEQARPFIQNHIMTNKRKVAMEAEVQRLRTSSKITYQGAFASQPAVSTANVTATTEELMEMTAEEKPEESSDNSTNTSTDFLDKGISGLK